MPVNFDILKPIQPQGGAISIPAQPSGMDQLAGGIMSGIQAGQQVAANRQQMQQNDKLMQMKEQLFPSQLQESQANAQTAQIGAQKAQQEQMDAKTLREAAAKGEADYIKAGVAQQGPKFEYEVRKSKADMQKAISDASEASLNVGIKLPQAIQAHALAIGEMFGNAQNAESQKPGDGQKVLNLQMSMLPPEIQKIYADQGMNQFTPQNSITAHSIGINAMATMKEEQEAKNASGNTELKKAQIDRDKAKAELDTAKQSKDIQAITEAQMKYDETVANVKGTVKQEPNADAAPIQKTVDYITTLKQQVESFPEGSQERQQAQQKLDFALSQAKQDAGLWSQIKSTVADVVGKTAGNIVKATMPNAPAAASSNPFQQELDSRNRK